jgi:putative heme-binding domain-containing protein
MTSSALSQNHAPQNPRLDKTGEKPVLTGRSAHAPARRIPMPASRMAVSSILCSLIAASGAFAQTTPDRDAPETEQASFKLPPGFEINLFASERDGVVKPIQMRWDGRGRLWVVGSTTYPQIKPGEAPNDKVWILQDTKGSGYADKVTVFADGLMIPTGLEIAHVEAESQNSAKTPAANPTSDLRPPTSSASAVYIGEGPKLWLMTDTDGDGVADKREVVLRGFGTGDNHQNINSFRWSPGGELMFSQGLHGYARVETPYGIVGMDQAGLWRLRPRQQRLDAFFGGSADPQNPWGWTFTKWGVPLISAGNSGNMYFPTPEMIRGFQGGRRETIWATGRGRKTSNPEIIESAHFPDEWQGALVTGGYINNGVWTLKVSQDGSGVKVEDHPTLPPLVQSGHGSFRPVDVKLGPDGALYICDWYNPIIGHYQASFRHPDRDKVHGRIWRVTYKGRPLLTPPPVLAGPAVASTSLPRLTMLAELLRSPDRYPREQAKFALFAENTAAVTTALRSWYQQLDPNAPDLDFVLMQVLGVFEAHETVELPLLKRVLAAKTPEARAYAAATLARWSDRFPLDYDPLEPLAEFAHDSDPRVRLAAVVAAGNIPRAESMVVILSAAKQPRDRFINTALLAATGVLKPQWEPLLAKGNSGWPADWLELVKTLDKPAAKPAPAKKVAQQVGAPIVPIYGRLRASPFVLDGIAKEVLARGNAENGSKVFHRPELACISCHRVGDQGGNIGPALDAIGSAQPLEFLIGMVIEPQREVKEGFETVRITTKKGAEVIGIVVAGNDAEVTLRDPAGTEHVVSQADIAKREFIGSLMPAGLTDNLSPEDLRDLFAYLTQLGKAK